MKDIYPMWKLCRLFLEKEKEWQREDTQAEVHFNNKIGSKRTDESIEEEVQVRIKAGQFKGRNKLKLVDDYIKKYYPEHTKPSDAFGALINLPKNRTGSDLNSETEQIIRNCLDQKYGFLKEAGYEIGRYRPDVVYLTGEGRDFASPPYFKFTRKIDFNVGLLKAYLGAFGLVWGIILSVIGFFIFSFITPILKYIYQHWDDIMTVIK